MGGHSAVRHDARLITEVRHKQATIEKLTREMAVLKWLKFAARSEAFTGEQKRLLEEAIDGGDPVGNGLCGTAELTRKLRRRAADCDKLQHLLSELRRVWRSVLGHLGLLLAFAG